MSLVIEMPKAGIQLTLVGQENLRVIFFGTPKFAVPALEALLKADWPVRAVVTAPDKPIGRHAVLTPSPVKKRAVESDLTVLTPTTLKDEETFETFKSLKPDICIVVAYGKIIPERFLEIPRLGFLNIHPSLLPEYRGPSPIQTAILDGQAKTGVSIMLLDKEMDHGPVLVQKPWDIPGGFDTSACEQELARLGAKLLVETLPGYVAGKIKPVDQDESKATFTRKFSRLDGELDWSSSARQINDKIRALGSNPGTWTKWNDMTLNIFGASPKTGSNSDSPGTVVRVDKKVGVVCGSDLLLLEDIQLEGGKVMPAVDFSNGHSDFIGSVLG